METAAKITGEWLGDNWKEITWNKNAERKEEKYGIGGQQKENHGERRRKKVRKLLGDNRKKHGEGRRKKVRKLLRG
jgi:hypothetical protein